MVIVSNITRLMSYVIMLYITRLIKRNGKIELHIFLLQELLRWIGAVKEASLSSLLPATQKLLLARSFRKFYYKLSRIQCTRLSY